MKNCFRQMLSGLRFGRNLQINLEAKRMDGSCSFFSITLEAGFFVRLQSAVSNICHHHFIGGLAKETDFSVKSLWEVH